MKIHCLALDLKDDPNLIAEYRRWHESDLIWPEVLAAIRSNDVLKEHIFLLGTRMVMVLETADDFRFEEKVAADRANPHMQEWENLMSRFQQSLPQAAPGEKWVIMEKIFEASAMIVASAALTEDNTEARMHKERG
jgi:L-rhamnose mutarotase